MEDKLFIVVHKQILELDGLSFSEKLVLARIAGFETYYESKEHLSAFFGGTINPLTCRKIKAKLVALGLVLVVKDTGRGKVYQCNFEKLGIPKPDEKRTQEKVAQEQLLGESAINSAVESSTTVLPYNKVKKKDKNIVLKNNIGSSSPDTSTKQFGNADINAMLEKWEDATGYDYTANKFERRAIYNLMRRKDIEAQGGLIPLISLVKEANHIDNRFAPKILKPSELGGKYSKLERLLEWAKHKGAGASAPQSNKSNKFEHKCTEQELAYISTYYKPHPYLEPSYYAPIEESKPTDYKALRKKALRNINKAVRLH